MVVWFVPAFFLDAICLCVRTDRQRSNRQTCVWSDRSVCTQFNFWSIPHLSHRSRSCVFCRYGCIGRESVCVRECVCISEVSELFVCRSGSSFRASTSFCYFSYLIAKSPSPTPIHPHRSYTFSLLFNTSPLTFLSL